MSPPYILTCVCVCVLSPWSSSRELFQTRIQSIACSTGSSTPGRASPSHWDSAELSSASKEVRIFPSCPRCKGENVYNCHTFPSCASLCLQRTARQRFSMRCSLTKNLLAVSTSGKRTCRGIIVGLETLLLLHSRRGRV